MPDSAILTRLEVFLDQSQRLLVLAQANDWEEFERLMTERQQLLPSLSENSFLIEVTKAGLADKAKAMINDIKQIDACIVESAEHSKKDIAAKLRQSHQASKALDAYRS
jgi:hypothetical protein